MKFENPSAGRLSNLNSVRGSQYLIQSQQDKKRQDDEDERSIAFSNANLRRQRHSGNGVGGGLFGCGFSDKDSVCSVNSIRGKRIRSRNIPMKSSKSVMKKTKVMDYTNYAYNEAVGRLKLMLADSYATPSKSTFGGSGLGSGYVRNYSEDSGDNFSDNLSVIERPVYSDISKYLSPSQKSRFGSSYRKKPLSGFSASKENLTCYQPIAATAPATTVPPLDYLMTPKQKIPVDSVQAPAEIFNFIEKQEDYIEQLEKESKYCRNELTNLLGKVKDVINENEQLTETARSELAALSGVDKAKHNFSPSSEDSEATVYANIKKPNSPRKKDMVKSPRYANAPSIVYEARISELEAELTQANIDLKRLRVENEDLKRKLSNADPVKTLTGHPMNNQLVSVINCDVHRKQIETLQMEKSALEDTIKHLQSSLDAAKSQQYNVTSKRYFNDLLQMERSQAELEVKHLRDELDRQHERVRELQHEMARRIAEERANAERRYNSQVDQLGGDLSNQWEQVAKLQLDSERSKRYETDLKRDLANRNAQIEELKMELRSNRSTFLADMAQANAEKQSLEQEITALRLQLDRAARESKTEASRYNAELNSLRQRLDRGDADLLHSKREVLRLNDEIANLEKELAYGEMKNEIRPTKKDLDKRISEMQEKHSETVNELEEMIQSQKQLMDKLTTECKILTKKLEDTTLKNNQEKKQLRETNAQLLERLKQIWANYKDICISSRPAHRRRHSFNSIASTDDNTGDSNREEHFSESAPILMKPLSTTSRPCLMQPKAQSQLMATHHISVTPQLSSMTTRNPLKAITTSLSSVQETVQLPATYLEQQQLLRQLQLRLHMTSTQQQQRNTTQSSMPFLTTKLVTANTDSAIMTTKISKTTLVQVKNNNNSNSSSRICNNQQTIAVPQSTISSAMIKPSNQLHSTPTWQPVTTMATMGSVQRSVSTIMAPLTIAVTKDTIHHSMTQAPTMQVPTIKRNTIQVSMVPPVPTIQVPVKDTIPMQDTVTTVPATMIHPSISSMTQQSIQQQQLLPSKTSHHRHQRNNHHHNQHYYHHHHHNNHSHHHRQHQQQRQQRLHQLQLQQSPRSHLAEQQQKAEYNRARAQVLWGQQVLQEPENPRSPVKSSFTESDTCWEPFDPSELELNISSPSLMCSSSLDSHSDRTEVGDKDFDSISEMSISPAPTAIRRLPNELSQTVCKSNGTPKQWSFNTL